MYVKNFVGNISIFTEKRRDDVFYPKTKESEHWKRWVTHISVNTCAECFDQNGKIYPIEQKLDIPVHPNCHCETTTNIAIKAGYATKDGKDGADYWLKYFGRLPDYYISRSDYIDAGWKNGKSPAKWFPDKMMYGEIYMNDKKLLPNALERIWYEADINYYEGRRNGHRIYFSNDGLIFVSYDHGCTFYEIV